MGPTSLPPYEHLKDLLKDANYDEALKCVTAWDLRNIDKDVHDSLKKLRFICMISDVWDYGGSYDNAERFIRDSGDIAYNRLVEVSSVDYLPETPEARAYLKQQCWAVLLWGMSFYRQSDYDRALKLFEQSKVVLTTIDKTGRPTCIGTLARAWYCVGLVQREKHDYSAARKAFRRSVELTGIGIARRTTHKEPTISFEYHMARCYGLGFGWIAYNEALLDEALADLVMARHLMRGKRARFIDGYVRQVHASIILSGSTEPDQIDQAIHLLRNAKATFSQEHGLCHKPYLLRADNELARALLRSAIASGQLARDNSRVQEAQGILERVKIAARQSSFGTRSHCMALITESRLAREFNDSQALELAEKAKELAGKLTFSLIDAHIAIGEAQLGLGNVPKAVTAFETALTYGKSSRKIVAVCRLHLCNAYLSINQPASALEQFNLWKDMSAGLENAFISSLAAKARENLERVFQNFKLSPADIKGESAAKYLNWLRRWLADTAMVLDHNKVKVAADRLKISDDTLNEWLKMERKIG